MYLLIEKSTNVVADIQAETFAVNAGFEWIEDKSVTDRTLVNTVTYDKQTKEFTKLPAQPQRPSELTDTFIAQKLEELDTKIESAKVSKEPILGVGQKQEASFNLLYLLVIPVVIGAYLLGKKL